MQINSYSIHAFRSFLLLFLLSGNMLLAQTSGYSGTGANIDVTYHRCEWRINPDSASKGIKGTVTIMPIFLSIIMAALSRSLFQPLEMYISSE